MKTLMMNIDEIKPYEKNPKNHPVSQIDRIMASIEEFGFVQPLVVDSDKTLIIGHGRFMAANRLGLTEVPVIIKEDLSINQVKALRIADNKLNESNWDIEFLKSEIGDLRFNDFELDLTGFGELEIDSMFKVKPKKEASDVNQVKKTGSLVLKCPSCGHEFKKED